MMEMCGLEQCFLNLCGYILFYVYYLLFYLDFFFFNFLNLCGFERWDLGTAVGHSAVEKE